MLAIGDPFAVTVANGDGRWTDKFAVGDLITLRLANDEVNNGRPTLKHTGRIVQSERISDGAGTRIQLNCADLGWHLRECNAPLKFDLQCGTFGDLFSEPLIDRSWGLYGDFGGPQGAWRARLRTDNEASRALRQGIRLTKGQQLQTNLAGIFRRVYVVQTEPGDMVADLLMEHARRFGLLVNVGPDGVIQVWNPDYSRAPNYRLDYFRDNDSRRQDNNVLSVRWTQDLSEIYTEVTCVGEIVGLEFAQLDPNDPNAGKKYGSISDPRLLPFVHRKTFCDGDMWSDELARSQAAWHRRRHLFDSFTGEVRFRGHWQRAYEGGLARWWESDELIAVNDEVNGIRGVFYIQAVRYDRTRDGDVTDVIIRLPDLLSASFGVLPKVTAELYPKALADAIGL